MKDLNLTKEDDEVFNLLYQGPETIQNIALETGLSVSIVRRCIHKLKFLGYIRPRFFERDGQCKAATFYEHVLTVPSSGSRKAA